jgi:hypothetical protein
MMTRAVPGAPLGAVAKWFRVYSLGVLLVEMKPSGLCGAVASAKAFRKLISLRGKSGLPRKAKAKTSKSSRDLARRRKYRRSV